MKTSLLLSAIAGLTSGVLTVVVPLHVPLYIKAGLLFGLAMATYFVFYEKCRSFAKLGVFVLMCTSACPISAISGYFADRFLTGGDLSGTLNGSGANLPAPALFFAGFVGASLVLVTGMFVLGPQDKDFPSLVRVLVWSTVGGVLGLSELLGSGSVLFVVWPTGVGLALSAMLARERRSFVPESTADADAIDSPIPDKNWVVRIAVGTVLVCSIGFLGRIVYYQMKFAHMRTEAKAAEKKVYGEMPSTQSLPPIVPVKLEDALVLTPISGFQPHTSFLRPDHLPAFQNLPYIEYYGN
jgi:hypothetical protein